MGRNDLCRLRKTRSELGHALIADALELGYAATVQAYLGCLAATQA